MQFNQAPEHCARQGWELVQPVDHYSDDGRSAQAGKLDKRDGLLRIFRDAAAGEFDAVVVWDINRLTRSQDWQERGLIFGSLQREGIRIADLKGQVLDLDTSQGDLLASLGAWQAAEEGRAISRRSLGGAARAFAEGRPPRGVKIYGLCYDRKSGFSFHPERGPLVVEIFRRVRACETLSSIADDLNARGVSLSQENKFGWTQERIGKLVRHTAYRGELLVRKSPRQTLKIPALISEADWYATQAVLAKHGARYHTRRADAFELLRGLGRCGTCGASIVVTKMRHESYAYVCRARQRRGICKQTSLKADWVDAIVWHQVSALLMTPGAYERRIAEGDKSEGATDWRAAAKRHDKRLAELQRNEVAILERFNAGKVSDRALTTMLDKIGAERSEVTGQREHARRELERASTREQSGAALASVLGELRALAEDATPGIRQLIVRRLVPSVSIKGRSVEIHVTALPSENDAAPSRNSARPGACIADPSSGITVRKAFTITAPYPKGFPSVPPL